MKIVPAPTKTVKPDSLCLRSASNCAPAQIANRSGNMSVVVLQQSFYLVH